MKKFSHVNFFSVIFFFAVFMIGCKTDPQPISYGSDACEFCKMTIVDNKFGGELITEKGKVYKFDSGECLIRFVKTQHIDISKAQRLLVVDHLGSGRMIDAQASNFLHSENLPSPMGGGLTAFEKKEDMELFKKTYGGEYWSWEQAMQKINP